MPEYDVFVSYSHRDRDWVSGRLVPDLRSNSLRVAIDDDDFEVGRFALTNMEAFVDASQHVVLVLTPDWVNSEWSQYEGVLASGSDPAARRRKTLPVLLRDCEPPHRIRALTYADFRDPSETNYQKQLSRLIRAAGINASGSANSTIRSESGQRAAEVFTILANDPTIRSAAIQFRATLEAAGEQITAVAEYKALHDKLHDLQYRCLDVINSNMRRFPQDEEAKETLDSARIDFEVIVENLQNVAQRFSKADTSWIVEVKTALDDLEKALATDDAALLRRVVRRLDHELTLRPPQINIRMNAAARALNFTALVGALATVSRISGTQAADLERLAQLRAGMDELALMGTRMAALVRDHDVWQELETELRAMEKNQDPQDIADFWDGFKIKAGVFLQQGAYPFSEAFGSESRRFQTVLEGADATKLRSAFRLIRRYVGSRFFEADADLKKHCDQLRQLGEPLNSLLAAISPSGVAPPKVN